MRSWIVLALLLLCMGCQWFRPHTLDCSTEGCCSNGCGANPDRIPISAYQTEIQGFKKTPLNGAVLGVPEEATQQVVFIQREPIVLPSVKTVPATPQKFAPANEASTPIPAQTGPTLEWDFVNIRFPVLRIFKAQERPSENSQRPPTSQPMTKPFSQVMVSTPEPPLAPQPSVGMPQTQVQPAVYVVAPLPPPTKRQTPLAPQTISPPPVHPTQNN